MAQNRNAERGIVTGVRVSSCLASRPRAEPEGILVVFLKFGDDDNRKLSLLSAFPANISTSFKTSNQVNRG